MVARSKPIATPVLAHSLCSWFSAWDRWLRDHQKLLNGWNWFIGCPDLDTGTNLVKGLEPLLQHLNSEERGAIDVSRLGIGRGSSGRILDALCRQLWSKCAIVDAHPAYADVAAAFDTIASDKQLFGSRRLVAVAAPAALALGAQVFHQQPSLEQFASETSTILDASRAANRHEWSRASRPGPPPVDSGAAAFIALVAIGLDFDPDQLVRP